MLNAIMGRKTVDSILATFSRAVDDLLKLEGEKLAEADFYDANRAQAEAAAFEARTEAARAGEARKRIAKLIPAAIEFPPLEALEDEAGDRVGSL